MRKLIGLLGNRWLLSCVGLGAVASVIWMIGPLIGFGSSRPLQSPSVRLIVILVMVVFWALNHMRKVIKANQANQGMVDGLVEAESAAEDPDRSAEEIATLKERFEEAVEVLKKSKGKKSRLSLYDLPWYIIIGPPGSGKTTALVNSGLEFPLAERYGKEALSGVGGTRNCDWWFTDEAILLDTAGRYTTQDSDADVDRSAWEGFLNLLKKYRRRRPINGVLVAISLSDLMVLNEHERISHARAIKTRIQELDQHFGIRFPVYVMLTKCDLVAGFMEFFDDLGRSEREQVWGVTFPIEASESAEGVVDRFGPELDGLLERLSDRLLWRMSQERDPRRRAAIYGFPRQLASLKQSVEGFLGDVFRGSRFEQAPMLRGIYFTSGTQEGTPIDRLMGAVARTYHLLECNKPVKSDILRTDSCNNFNRQSIMTIESKTLSTWIAMKSFEVLFFGSLSDIWAEVGASVMEMIPQEIVPGRRKGDTLVEVISDPCIEAELLRDDQLLAIEITNKEQPETIADTAVSVASLTSIEAGRSNAKEDNMEVLQILHSLKTYLSQPITHLRIPPFGGTGSLVHVDININITGVYKTPLVPGPASSYKAIYTALMRAQGISAWSYGDSSKSIISLDLDLYEVLYACQFQGRHARQVHITPRGIACRFCSH